MSINIIYEDDYLIILNKQPNLLSVPGKGADKQDCLYNRVKNIAPELYIVHRLDMATSGLIIFAKSIEIQRLLSIKFEKREIDKTYIALCDGELKNKSGIIDLPLITDWPNRPKQKIDYEIGKPSQTNYELIDYKNNISRVNLMPITGRSHQLRVHLASIGNPILGDYFYNDNYSLYNRLMLHATKLEFYHPINNQKLLIENNPEF